MNIADPEVAAQVKAIMKQDVYKIMKETSRVSRDAIDAFYGDYSPQYYQRVWGLKNLFDIDLSEKDDGYLLRFTYSYGHIGGHKNPSVIFYGPFLQGYHGGPIMEADGYEYDYRGKPVATGYHYNPAPQMQPSPWDRIKTFAENIGGVIS